MNHYLHRKDVFVSWEHTGGRVEYPDAVEHFSNVESIYDEGNVVNYIVAEYTGNEAITNALSFNDYFDLAHRDELTESLRTQIKSEQARMLDELEGTPEKPGLWQRKYIEEITIKDSFDRYDDLMKKKAYVINHGNAEEAKLESLTPDELLSYHFTCNLDDAPELSIRRITVGAFMLRFTATENTAFKQAVEVNQDMKLMLDSLTSRTHVHLNNSDIVNALALLNQAGLLEDSPQNASYETRVDELLRDGSPDEQYRVLSYA